MLSTQPVSLDCDAKSSLHEATLSDQSSDKQQFLATCKWVLGLQKFIVKEFAAKLPSVRSVSLRVH